MGRKREISRVEGLSDGVFAFAATLLVVSLEVPHTFAELSAQLYGFVGFGISFGALLLIWSVHNAYFRRYAIDDGWTIALNGFLLLVVVFYVYPLKFVTGGLVSNLFLQGKEAFVVSGPDQLGQLLALYSAGFVGVFFSFALMYRHAGASAEKLNLSPFEKGEAKFLFRHYLIFVGVGLLSIGLALFRIGVTFGLPGWVYSVLGPLCWAHGEWSGRRLNALRSTEETEPSGS